MNKLNFCLSFLIILILFFLYIIPIYLKDKEIPYNNIQHQLFTPNMLKINLPPTTLLNNQNKNEKENKENENIKYNYGKYSNPIILPSLHQLNIFQLILQKKEWHFIAISDGTLLIGMAVANLGYIETSFIYFCDTKNKIHDKISFVLPGGANAAIVSPSSIDPEICSTFSSSLTNFKVSICYISETKSWKLVGSGTLENKSLISYDIHLRRTGLDEFSLVYPIGPNRFFILFYLILIYFEKTNHHYYSLFVIELHILIKLHHYLLKVFFLLLYLENLNYHLNHFMEQD